MGYSFVLGVGAEDSEPGAATLYPLLHITPTPRPRLVSTHRAPAYPSTGQPPSLPTTLCSHLVIQHHTCHMQIWIQNSVLLIPTSIPQARTCLDHPKFTSHPEFSTHHPKAGISS